MKHSVIFGLAALVLFNACKTEEDCIESDTYVYDMPSEGDPGEEFKVFGNCTVFIDDVVINGAQANWHINLLNKLVFTVPSDAAVSGNAIVYARGQQIYNAPFTAKVPPTWSSLSTYSGTVGSFVTIYGTNFCASPTVTFSGAASASISGQTCGYLIVQVPGGATDGPITVTTSYGTVVTGSFNVL